MTYNGNDIAKYIDAAIMHGDALVNGDKKVANQNYAKLKKMLRQLSIDRMEAEKILQILLNHENHHVQSWAAAHSLYLGVNMETAQQTLRNISNRNDIGIARLNAEMILETWKMKGRLIF